MMACIGWSASASVGPAQFRQDEISYLVQRDRPLIGIETEAFRLPQKVPEASHVRRRILVTGERVNYATSYNYAEKVSLEIGRIKPQHCFPPSDFLRTKSSGYWGIYNVIAGENNEARPILSRFSYIFAKVSLSFGCVSYVSDNEWIKFGVEGRQFADVQSLSAQGQLKPFGIKNEWFQYFKLSFEPRPLIGLHQDQLPLHNTQLATSKTGLPSSNTRVSNYGNYPNNGDPKYWWVFTGPSVFIFGCCLVIWGWHFLLARISTLRGLTLVGAGACLIFWAVIHIMSLLAPLNRRSENVRVHPVIVAELEFGDRHKG
jgi:hypothetical protein